MKTAFATTFLLAVMAFHADSMQAQPPPPAPAGAELNRRVDDILNGMTLEDKVGEMTQLTLDMLCVGEPYNLVEPVRLDPEKMRKVLVDLRVGSILNAPNHTLPRERWIEIISAIQKMATEQKPTGIPVLYGIDAIHGVNYTQGATLFPQQINLAATWDPEIALSTGKIVAYETRASGIPWAFSPVLDIGRDPRWPRFWETFGEDPLLASRMGKAIIQGYQGNKLSDPFSVAACMKHFLGYSMTISGRDRTQSWIPDRELRAIFAPSFREAIDAGARTIMINSGEINGIPVHINPAILKGLLRDELGFQGVAVSDWEDIKYLYTRHRVTADYRESIAMAINAGIDMSMVPTDLEFPVLLAELVREGRVPEARIDEAVRRIIRLKVELGLFEYPLGSEKKFPEFGSAGNAEASYGAAVESITLLRNRDNVLPLSQGSRIFVTGPMANSLNALNGAWTHTWQGLDTIWNTPGKPTLVEALRKAAPGRVDYLPGSSFDQAGNLTEVTSRARQADVVVVCLGEMPYTEKPGDISDLDLPQAQKDLLRAAEAAGKPVVLVLVEGRPRTFGDIAELPDAVVMGYLPGDEGGRALADVLLGTQSPGGRLPFTYPRHSNALLTYDHKRTDELDTKFGWTAFDPLFAFGDGMDYTTFSCTAPKLSSEVWDGKGELVVSVEVSNTGKRSGSEVVACFLDDEVASITPPVKRLVGFSKLRLEPGASARVEFFLTVKDLAFLGADGLSKIEPGSFRVIVNKGEARFELLSTLKP